MPWPGIKPATSAYQDNALIIKATHPGLHVSNYDEWLPFQETEKIFLKIIFKKFFLRIWPFHFSFQKREIVCWFLSAAWQSLNSTARHSKLSTGWLQTTLEAALQSLVFKHFTVHSDWSVCHFPDIPPCFPFRAFANYIFTSWELISSFLQFDAMYQGLNNMPTLSHSNSPTRKIIQDVYKDLA